MINNIKYYIIITAIVFVGLLIFALLGDMLFSAEIVAALIAFSGIVMASFITQYYTHEREIEARLFEKKVSVYNSVVKLLFKAIMHVKKIKTVTQEELTKDYIFINRTLIAWGGHSVMLAWRNFNNVTAIHDSKNQISTVIVLLTYNKLLMAIRKDLNHNDKELNRLDLIKVIMNPEESSKLEKILEEQQHET